MEERYTRLEDYLEDHLTDAERTALEAELANDPTLRDDLNLLRAARDTLGRQASDAEADAALQATLTELNRKHFSEAPSSPAGATEQVDSHAPTPSRKSATVRWLSVYWRTIAAAAAVFVLGWAAVHWLGDDTPTYAAYAEHDPAAFTEMGTTTEETLEAAATAFNRGDYATAAPLLDQARTALPDRPDLQLYYAITQLETEHWAKARTALTPLLEVPDYRNEAHWYLALSWLSEQEWAQVRDHLEQITPGSHRYVAAEGLLNELP